MYFLWSSKIPEKLFLAQKTCIEDLYEGVPGIQYIMRIDDQYEEEPGYHMRYIYNIYFIQ